MDMAFRPCTPAPSPTPGHRHHLPTLLLPEKPPPSPPTAPYPWLWRCHKCVRIYRFSAALNRCLSCSHRFCRRCVSEVDYEGWDRWKAYYTPPATPSPGRADFCMRRRPSTAGNGEDQDMDRSSSSSESEESEQADFDRQEEEIRDWYATKAKELEPEASDEECKQAAARPREDGDDEAEDDPVFSPGEEPPSQLLPVAFEEPMSPTTRRWRAMVQETTSTLPPKAKVMDIRRPPGLELCMPDPSRRRSSAGTVGASSLAEAQDWMRGLAAQDWTRGLEAQPDSAF